MAGIPTYVREEGDTFWLEQINWRMTCTRICHVSRELKDRLHHFTDTNQEKEKSVAIVKRCYRIQQG